jgi:membrane protease YdiL (CAAX protease family)
MERKPDPQQVEVIAVVPEAVQDMSDRRSWGRLAIVCFFMIWPWILVGTGLFILKDFRITIVLYELLGCVMPFMVLRRTNVQLFPIGVPIRWIVLMVIIANIAFLTRWKFMAPDILDWPHFYEHAQNINLGPNNNFWGYGIYLVFFNPLFEESFWRGVIYNEWKNFVSPLTANLISSFFFGAWHWVILQYFCTPFQAIFLTCLVMFGGMIFCYAYERDGTLGASVLMHGWGADFPLMFFVYSAVMNSAGLIP